MAQSKHSEYPKAKPNASSRITQTSKYRVQPTLNSCTARFAKDLESYWPTGPYYHSSNKPKGLRLKALNGRNARPHQTNQCTHNRTIVRSKCGSPGLYCARDILTTYFLTCCSYICCIHTVFIQITASSSNINNMPYFFTFQAQTSSGSCMY